MRRVPRGRHRRPLRRDYVKVEHAVWDDRAKIGDFREILAVLEAARSQ